MYTVKISVASSCLSNLFTGAAIKLETTRNGELYTKVIPVEIQEKTTANKALLIALAKAVSILKVPCKIIIQAPLYIALGINSLDKWIDNGGKTSSKSNVANFKEWMEYKNEISNNHHEITKVISCIDASIAEIAKEQAKKARMSWYENRRTI